MLYRHLSRFLPGRSLALMLLLHLLFASATVWATSSPDGVTFSLSRQTLDAGGGLAGGGGVVVNASIGQPDAGPTHSGGVFVLSGGFHISRGDPGSGDALFADRFESGGGR